jgi:hypothetical protein
MWSLTPISKTFLADAVRAISIGNMNAWKHSHNTRRCGVSRIDPLDNAVSILALGLEQGLAYFFGSPSLKVPCHPN